MKSKSPKLPRDLFGLGTNQGVDMVPVPRFTTIEKWRRVFSLYGRVPLYTARDIRRFLILQRFLLALKVPDVSALYFLNTLLGNNSNPLGGATCKLFKNNYTPVAGSVLGDFTEADFSGYTSQALTGWTTPATVSAHARTTATALSWTKSGATGNSIYGYYVVNGSNLLFAERDPNAPIAMTTNGDSYTVAISFTDASEF